MTGHLKPFRAIGSIGNEFAASISSSLSPPRAPRASQGAKILMFRNMFQGQGQDQDQGQGQGQDHEKVRRRGAPLQLQMVYKKGMIIKKFGVIGTYWKHIGKIKQNQ